MVAYISRAPFFSFVFMFSFSKSLLKHTPEINERIPLFLLEIYLKILFGFLLLADAADASAATVDEEEEASRGSSSPTEEEEAEEEEATDIASASSSAHHQGGRTRWGNLSWSSTISHTQKKPTLFWNRGDWAIGAPASVLALPLYTVRFSRLDSVSLQGEEREKFWPFPGRCESLS